MGRRTLALVLPLAAVTALVGRPPSLDAQTPEDLAIGERIFSAQCARCHGMGGTGGEGPALVGRRFRTVSKQDDIVGVILDGLGAMPGIWMGEVEANQIAAYVWSLARTRSAPVPGDAAAGEALFRGKGACTTCHIVAGHGSGLGPELTDVGARRGADYLRQAIVAPGAELPKGSLTPHASFLLIRATNARGEQIEGLRIWEDAFVVEIRDAAGVYHHLIKAELSSYERRFGVSLMPDYAQTLSAGEVTDLVAYLASLRGES